MGSEKVGQQSVAPSRTDMDIIQTASVTALMRALLADETGILNNPDYLAKYFINDQWRPFLNDPAVSRQALETRVPGTLYYLLLRTKYFDRSLKDWILRNPDSQVVFLGTGFDTRSIRFAKELKDARVYEVDLKAMLDYKKDVINRNGLETTASNKIYVPINFHIENILEKLIENGFDTSKKSYFLWEGVTFFLEEGTVKKFLKNLADSLKASTTVAFDYVFKDYVEGNLEYYGAKEIHRELMQLGEPHIFGVNFRDMDSFAINLGYLCRNNLTALMLESQYLAGSNGMSETRPNSFSAMTEICKE